VEWRWPETGSRGFNHLPYRMLVPPGVSNLLVAGRCAAMSHEGQSAARVSGGCFVMGEAAGTAAHLAIAGDVAAADVDVAALQRLLERGGVFLGRSNDELPSPVFELRPA
jgi:FAD-dependent oxidoreductase family protein